VDTSGIFKSYVSVTLGVGAIGSPQGNDANSFIDSAFLSDNFAPAFNKDYSLGVGGVVSAVPEPSAFVLFEVGAAGAVLLRRPRQSMPASSRAAGGIDPGEAELAAERS
jgi:hypothetical protein